MGPAPAGAPPFSHAHKEPRMPPSISPSPALSTPPRAGRHAFPWFPPDSTREVGATPCCPDQQAPLTRVVVAVMLRTMDLTRLTPQTEAAPGSFLDSQGLALGPGHGCWSRADPDAPRRRAFTPGVSAGSLGSMPAQLGYIWFAHFF